MSRSLEFDRQRLKSLRCLPLEPLNYCQRWVSVDPHRSHRKACIHALANATGLSRHTINNWGTDFSRRPGYIPHLLRQVDLLNQIENLIRQQQIYLSHQNLQE